MDFLFDEITRYGLLPIISVILVVLIETYLPWSDKYHPLTFINLLADRMAYKVHRKKPGTKVEQSIAGALSPIVLLAPFLIILWILVSLAEYPIFFDSLLLLVALRFQPVIKACRKIHSALRQDKKVLARHTLQNIVLRETQNLSSFGVAKGAIESLLLRFSHQYCCVILIYLVGGGIPAITYRLFYECSHSWPSKLPTFKVFGQPIRYLVTIIQWLPALISVICFIIGQNIILGLSAIKRQSYINCARRLLLNAQGGSLGIQLGGPVYYAAKKYRLAKCGGQRNVTIDDIQRAVIAIRRAQLVFITFCFIIILLLNLRA